MRKQIPTMLLFIIFTVVLLTCGCSPNPVVSETAEPSVKENNVEDFSKTMDFNQIIDLDKMKLRIINISLVKNTDTSEDAPVGKIALGVEIGNVSDEDAFFYPEQFEMTLNTGEALSPDLTLTSSLGGTYPPKRTEQGFITFPIKESELSSIEYCQLKVPILTTKEGSKEIKEVSLALEELKF